MKLVYFRSNPTNFGDELNAYMWKRLLPEGFLDDNEEELFVGIGSIIGEIYSPDSIKHVIGSGMGGYSPPPNLQNGRWNMVFVRGPMTAKALDLPQKNAICDSALLLREISDLPAPASGINVAYMPHYESLMRGPWKHICHEAGVHFIDPTLPPCEIIAQIRGAKFLITEAMHGAIVADALRTPWVAARPWYSVHRAKWTDWAQSLGMEINWHPVPAASIRDLLTLVTKSSGTGRLLTHRWPEAWYMAPISSHLVRSTVRWLRGVAATASPQLSDDTVIKLVTSRARAALDEFVTTHSGHMKKADLPSDLPNDPARDRPRSETDSNANELHGREDHLHSIGA